MRRPLQIIELPAAHGPPEDRTDQKGQHDGQRNEQVQDVHGSHEIDRGLHGGHRFDGAPRDFLAIFRDYYGPTMNAFEAAARDGRREALQAELEALFQAENRGDAGRTEIPATYLKVIVTK